MNLQSIRAHLVDDVNQAKTWLSMKLAALGALINLVYSWLPEDWQQHVPTKWIAWISGAVFIATMVGRIFKQSSPPPPAA